MILPPLSVVATWPPANYTNPITRGSSFTIISVLFVSSAIIAVVLRLYVRVFIKKWLGWDDLFIVLALFSSIGITVVFEIGAAKFGWTRHIRDIPITYISGSYKVLYALEIFFLLNSGFTVLSLLAFYNYFNRTANIRWFRWCICAALTFCCTTWPIFFFLTVFRCSPIHAFWDYPPLPGGKCVNQAFITFGGTCIKLVQDFWLTTMPIPLILGLQMSRERKIAISCLLGVGYLVTLAGIVRTYYTWKCFFATWDITWYEYPAVMAAVIENNLSVICACVPAIRPLFGDNAFESIRERFSRRLTKQSNSTDSSHSNGPRHAPSSEPLRGNWIRERRTSIASSVFVIQRPGDSSRESLELDMTHRDKFGMYEG